MQSPIINHQSAIPQPTSDRIRQNTTEYHKMQRNLVRARSLIHAHAREAPHPPPSFPHTPPSFPRRRESLLPTWIAPRSQRILGSAVP